MVIFCGGWYFFLLSREYFRHVAVGGIYKSRKYEAVTCASFWILNNRYILVARSKKDLKIDDLPHMSRCLPDVEVDRDICSYS